MRVNLWKVMLQNRPFKLLKIKNNQRIQNGFATDSPEDDHVRVPDDRGVVRPRDERFRWRIRRNEFRPRHGIDFEEIQFALGFARAAAKHDHVALVVNCGVLAARGRRRTTLEQRIMRLMGVLVVRLRLAGNGAMERGGNPTAPLDIVNHDIVEWSAGGIVTAVNIESGVNEDGGVVGALKRRGTNEIFLLLPETGSRRNVGRTAGRDQDNAATWAAVGASWELGK